MKVRMMDGGGKEVKKPGRRDRGCAFARPLVLDLCVCVCVRRERESGGCTRKKLGTSETQR